MSDELVILEVRNARDSEESPTSMEHVLAALGGGSGHGGLFSRLFHGKKTSPFVSLEIISVNSRIHFFVVVPKTLQEYVENQLTAQYPKILLTPVSDYTEHFMALPHTTGQLVLTGPFYIPVKTFQDVKDLDILSGVLGQMAKVPQNHAASIQVRIESIGTGWRTTCQKIIDQGIPDPHSTQGRSKAHPQASLIESKIAQTGFQTSIRIMTVAGTEAEAGSLLGSVAQSFGVYRLGEGNSFTLKNPAFWQKKKLEDAFVQRSAALTPRFQVLGSVELASLWHPPGEALSLIKNIAWGSSLTGEPPENLPIASGDEEEKKRINFIARCEYKNKTTTFGIKKDDRGKHLYIVGKTGSGKSTLIANMAINDMRNREGVAVIDPHGDLSDMLLDYIPSYRINDVAFLDPSDFDHPFHLNPLEVTNETYREIVASGIVSIFHKLYAHSWGPRLEYILRNTLLTLLQVPDSTLLQIPELLANNRYREKVVDKLNDNILKNYWNNEFNKMGERLRNEAISPILNKVGQFLSSRTIRNILKSPKSTIDLSKMMDEGKIVIVNLSQGKLGEDNSSLLGAMVITKMQLAAMSRVYMDEEKRRDFYLYVDEFQNFATNAFVKILSEARKYKLNLTLANQYIGQIEEDVQKAIFGNIGSLITFSVGAQDARVLSSELGGAYKEEELVGLGNFQTIVKLSIDNNTSRPFSAITLPLPRSKNQNRDKIVRSSRERFTKTLKKA